MVSTVVQKVMKNGGKIDGFNMKSDGKIDVFKMVQKVMKNGGKTDGFNSGPESYEKWWEN